MVIFHAFTELVSVVAVAMLAVIAAFLWPVQKVLATVAKNPKSWLGGNPIGLQWWLKTCAAGFKKARYLLGFFSRKYMPDLHNRLRDIFER